MKSFIIATILLVLICAGTIVNSYFVADLCDKLADGLSYIPELDKDALDSLYVIWDGSTTIFRLTVNASIINSISDKLSRMESAANTGDLSLWEEMRLSARDAILIIRGEASLDLKNII